MAAEHLSLFCTQFALCHGLLLLDSDVAHIPPGHFTGTGAVIWLPYYQGSNTEEYDMRKQILWIQKNRRQYNHNKTPQNHVYIL